MQLQEMVHAQYFCPTVSRGNKCQFYFFQFLFDLENWIDRFEGYKYIAT